MGQIKCQYIGIYFLRRFNDQKGFTAEQARTQSNNAFIGQRSLAKNLINKKFGSCFISARSTLSAVKVCHYKIIIESP
jgi:hypothetical protein